MTRNLSRAVIVVIVVLHGISAGRSVEAATTVQQDGRDLFQQALLRERADGKLEEAIEIYKSVLAVAADDRGLAAQALVRIGACYEKLGRPEATDTYEQVLRDYPDQAEAVAAAQTRLEPAAPSPTMTVREVMRSSEQAPSDISYPGGDPYFAVSGDGQTFVYRDPPTGDLAVRNMATGEARLMYGIPRDYTGDEQFRNPILSRDGNKVAFMRFPNSAGGTRLEVDSLGGGHRETLFDFGEGWSNSDTRDWSPDGANILIVGEAADRSRFLATVSLEDKALRRLVTLDWGAPRRAEYSPDGRFIAYDSTKRGDSKIYLMSADGAEERVLVDSSGEDDSPLWTRDGRFLLFRSDRSGKWDLYALPMRHGEPAGEAVVVKSNLGAGTSLRAVTTEGQLVYFEVVGGFDVAIAERIDSTATTVHASILPKWQTIENKRPGFAPDGRRVVYLAGGLGGSKVTIRVTDLEGKILTDIPLPGFSTIDKPVFSPDGKRIALRVYDAGEPRLMVLSADRGTVLKVVSPLEKGYAVVRGWSPDSRLLYAFIAGTGEPSLATIDVDTEQMVDSTVLPDTARDAWLSPSGTHLALVLGAFSPGPGLSTQLVLRSLEDGSERLLTEKDGPFGSFSFVWDHDSRHLIMYRKSGDPRLYSFSLDTEEETVLVEDMENLNLTAVSSDGSYWALEVRGQRDTLILALENSTRRTSQPKRQRTGRPTLSAGQALTE